MTEPVEIVPGSEEVQKLKVVMKQLNGETFDIELMKDATVLGLKTMIFQQRNITIDRQRLIFRAQELTNNDSLISQYGINNGSVLHIVVRNIDPPSTGGNNTIINIPEQNLDEGTTNENNQYDQQVIYGQDVNIYQITKLCRFIKIMSIFNAIFLFLYIFSVSLYLLILCLLSIAGYIGAKYLKRFYLFVYMLCTIMDVGLRVTLMYLFRSDPIDIILLLLMILIDMFLFKCTVQLYRAIPSLPDEAKNYILHVNTAGYF